MFVPQNHLSMKHHLFKGLFVLFLFFHVQHAHSQLYFGGGMKFNSNTEFKALGLNAKVGKDISEKFETLLITLGAKLPGLWIWICITDYSISMINYS